MVEGLLEEGSASLEVGKLDEDCTEFVDDSQVVGKAFEDGEEGVAGLQGVVN